jgi:hypothetical protein
LVTSRDSNSSAVQVLFLRASLFVRGNNAVLQIGGLLGDGYLWRDDTGTSGKAARFDSIKNEMVSERQSEDLGGYTVGWRKAALTWV